MVGQQLESLYTIFSEESDQRLTRMRRTGLSKQILTGLMLALLVLPASTVRAQWAVYDAANHATQLGKMAQDAARWVQTLNHYLEEIRKYETMIDKQVERITNLGNILHTVDEQLARDKSLIYTVSGFGQTIRQIFQLEQDVRTMVTCHILAVERVWQRMRQGIFDPQQNMRDLEDYLRDSIGRSAENRVAYLELLLAQDTEFSTWRRPAPHRPRAHSRRSTGRSRVLSASGTHS